ncbi:MAG: heparinase II/III family protein [Planctomycetota bacterium]|nr:heparinase II/III family protein [Planctomycetota bacterium]
MKMTNPILLAMCLAIAARGFAAEPVPPQTGTGAVIKQLSDLIDLTRPDLAEVRRQVEGGDLPSAMREYRAFLSRRTAKLPPQRGHSYWLHNPADADRLLNGELITARYGDTSITYTVPIGKPGHINFFTELPNYREIARDISTMQWVNKHCEAYAKTKDIRYLQAWCDTWADYLAHWDAQWAAVKANPAMWGKGPQREGRINGIEWAGGQALYTGWRLSAERSGMIAMLQLAPANGHLEQLNQDVLAGLLVRAFTAEIGNGRRILKGAERAVPNQVRGLAEEILNCGLTFTEFKDSKAWRSESIPVCCLTSQPDGTSREQSLNYFINYFPGLIKKVSTGMPPEEQDAALIERLETMNKYQDRVLLSLARPSGFAPATGTDPIWNNYGKTKPLNPPSTAFTSILCPYGGYAVQRDGWKPDSLYLFMKVSRPNTGHWRAIEAGLQLSAFGRDLLVSPVGNLYDARDSEKGWRIYWESSVGQNTILVDGMSAAERKGDFNKLDPMRWYASPRFDFMETEVTGPFQGSDFRANGRAIQERIKNGLVKDKPAIKDVVFRRQVHFLKAAACWIVTDRISAKEAHDFTQTWNFGPEYTENQVTMDKAKKSVTTCQPDAPNLSLFQFGAPPIEYQRYYGVYDDDHILGWVGILKDKEKWLYTPAPCVHVNWRGKGGQLLVTLLRPHRGTDAQLRSVADKTVGDAAGFDAVLADGTSIFYRAAVAPSTLDAGGVRADAASLLVVCSAAGQSAGVVLDARMFAGKVPEQPNFEFEIAGGEQPANTTPITVPTGFRWEGPPDRLVPKYVEDR